MCAKGLASLATVSIRDHVPGKMQSFPVCMSILCVCVLAHVHALTVIESKIVRLKCICILTVFEAWTKGPLLRNSVTL